ncbi:MAG: exo-alpha-sialidase, partial [Candidatus Omnitrophica bacterium]|nr:exo-alpha-sialidase [Candidatus Omnitrophota bacterium]
RKLFLVLGLWIVAAPPIYSDPPASPVGPLPVETLDGDKFTMDYFDSREGWVFVFVSARCPETEKHIRDLEALHEKYRFEKILMVGVCSNPAESGKELRAFAQRRGVRFPIYRDPEGEIAKRFGAALTPEAFLLDGNGNIRYHGAVGQPLEAAVEAFHRGNNIQPKVTEATGTAIDHPAPPREIDDPYGVIHFSSELIFERAGDAAAHHCSTITEAPNGDLLCLWYGGSYESADDQSLYLSRRKKGERTWSEPEILIRNSLRPPGNALIFTGPQDRVWVLWGRMDAVRPIRRGSGWTECTLMVRTSSDNGMTWTEDTPFPWEKRRALPRNLPIQLKSGDFLLPLTGEGTNGVYGAMAAITSDGGTTWKPSMALRRVSQPTVIQRSDGSLLALLRTDPRIKMSESSDGGFTWSTPTPTDLKCPGAGISMTQLDNGHLILVFNDSEEDRTPLSIVRSTDEGKTWEEPLHLESNPGPYSYPCIMQSSDGTIHITYTFRRFSIKHVEMNENWLTQMVRPN